jgi:O-antigen/teichoic acid export membrane protein
MLKYLRQLASESLIYGLANIISRFLNVLLVPIYTRLFTPEDYGVMSLVTTSMAVVSILVVLGLDNSAHRWYWDTEEIEHQKSTLASWAWCQVFVSSVFAIVIFIYAGWFSSLIVGNKIAALYFQLTAIALPLSALQKVTNGWLRMRRRPWATMAYSLTISLLTIVLTIVFVIYLRWGLTGIYAAQVITAGVSTVIAIALMRDWISPWHFQWQRLSEMLRYALPMIPAGLALWVVNLSDRYFLQFYTSTSEVGLYQVGSSIAAFVALVTGAFQQAWGPFAMSIHQQTDAKKVYAQVLLTYLWLTSLISTALTLFAPEAIQIFATQQYLGASKVVGSLTFSYVMIGLTYIASIGPALVKTSTPTGLAITFAAGLNLILNFILVPSMGMMGAAVATLLSQSIISPYIFWRSQQLYPISYRFKPAIAILALSAFLVWASTYWSFENLFLEIGYKFTLLALFIPAIFLFRIIPVKNFIDFFGLSK